MARSVRWTALRALRKVGLLSRLNLVVPANHLGRRIRIPVTGGLGLEHRKMPDPHLLPAFRASLALRGGAFVDVGAHLGQTLVKLLALGDDRRYVGFEPQPRAASYLERLLAANREGGDAVVAAALGELNGATELLLAKDVDEAASIVAGFRPRERYGQRWIVPLLRGDDALAEIGVGPVGVLKVDAEGAELEILRGFAGTIGSERPVILCEILPIYDEGTEVGRLRRARADALVELLGGHGYRLLRIDPSGSVAPLDRVETHGDVALRDYACVPAEDRERFEGLARGGAERVPGQVPG